MAELLAITLGQLTVAVLAEALKAAVWSAVFVAILNRFAKDA